jgi:hypothetical protein
MGASSSTSVSNVKELNATSIGMSQKTFNEIQNTCNSNTAQHNVLNIIGSTITKLTTNQKNVGKNICVLQTALNTAQDSSAQAAMMASIKNALETSASAGIGIGIANSNQNTDITNKFDANISNETINKAITGCVNNLDQSNVINIIGSNVTGSDLTQTNDSFMSCLSDNGAKTTQSAGAAGTSSGAADVSGTTTSKGLDPTAILQAYSGMIFGCSLLCVVLLIVLSLISTSSGGQAQTAQLGQLAQTYQQSH